MRDAAKALSFLPLCRCASWGCAAAGVTLLLLSLLFIKAVSLCAESTSIVLCEIWHGREDSLDGCSCNYIVHKISIVSFCSFATCYEKGWSYVYWQRNYCQLL